MYSLLYDRLLTNLIDVRNIGMKYMIYLTRWSLNTVSVLEYIDLGLYTIHISVYCECFSFYVCFPHFIMFQMTHTQAKKLLFIYDYEL